MLGVCQNVVCVVEAMREGNADADQKADDDRQWREYYKESVGIAKTNLALPNGYVRPDALAAEAGLLADALLAEQKRRGR